MSRELREEGVGDPDDPPGEEESPRELMARLLRTMMFAGYRTILRDESEREKKKKQEAEEKKAQEKAKVVDEDTPER